MALYRVKPAVVRATQWHKQGDHTAVIHGLLTPEGLVTSIDGIAIWDGAAGVTEAYVVSTPQGFQQVNPGDWIVRNHDGSYTALNQEQFSSLYEYAAD